MSYTKQQKLIMQEFQKQAPYWSAPISEHEKWIIRHLRLQKDSCVLDVGAGTGLLSRAISPHVANIIALDLSPDMLNVGREDAKNQGFNNITFQEGIAESIPFPDQHFDLIVSRWLIHHLDNPLDALIEMKRVCKNKGNIAVVDLISPDDIDIAKTYNKIEHLRDQSHTWAFSANDFDTLIKNVGLKIIDVFFKTSIVDANVWLNRVEISPKKRQSILVVLNKELNGGDKTGLQPFLHHGNLMFKHQLRMVIGQK